MEYKSPEEPDRHLEALRAARALPEALHFIATDAMQRMQPELVAAMRAGEDTTELAAQYRLLAEEVANSQTGAKSVLAQIGLIIHIGLLRREGGRYEDFREDLEDAILYAHNLGLDDVVLALEEMRATHF